MNRKYRDVFYINANLAKNKFIYYGMEFNEFIKSIPRRLDNLLLLQPNGVGEKYHAKIKMNAMEGKSAIKELAAMDIYKLGDFAWIDYNDSYNVENMSPMEIADLLYLTHFEEPLHTIFFEKLSNQYVYLAHDDGWYCCLYCHQQEDFRDIIMNKITMTVTSITKTKVNSIGQEIGQKLLQLSKDGLLVDFGNIMKNGIGKIEIPIYTIGKFTDMDSMYNDLEKHKANASTQVQLVYNREKWLFDR